MGCSSAGDDACEGSAGCRCYDNGTCNAGFACGANGLCGIATANGTAASNLVDECNADLTCRYEADEFMYGIELRRVGDHCLLSTSVPPTELLADGTASGATEVGPSNGVCSPMGRCSCVTETRVSSCAGRTI